MNNTNTTGPNAVLSAALNKGRKLYPLNGHYKATPARLDHLSTVSLDWVNLWTAAHGGLKVPSRYNSGGQVA